MRVGVGIVPVPPPGHSGAEGMSMSNEGGDRVKLAARRTILQGQTLNRESARAP